MFISNQQLEWHLLEEDVSSEPLWLITETEHTETDAGHRMDGTLRFYELLFGITLLYTISIFLVWQWTERRISGLELEIQALQDAPTQSLLDTDGPDVRIMDNNMVSPLQFETNHLRFEISQRMAELLDSTYRRFENGDQPTVTMIESMASASDTHYRKLLQEFDLPLDTSAQKLTIVVDPLPSDYDPSNNDRIVRVPLPDFARGQYNTGYVNVLTGEIFRQLTNHFSKRSIYITQTPRPPLP